MNDLEKLMCADGACPFYKTKKESESGREATNKKIRRLSPEIQAKISLKYYGNKMPWNEENHNDT